MTFSVEQRNTLIKEYENTLIALNRRFSGPSYTIGGLREILEEFKANTDPEWR